MKTARQPFDDFAGADLTVPAVVRVTVDPDLHPDSSLRLVMAYASAALETSPAVPAPGRPHEEEHR
jgi:hypothetical protein